MMLSWLFGSSKNKTKNETKTIAVDTRRITARFDSAETTADNIMHWSKANALSADAEASYPVRKIIRERSRYEIANNTYAHGLVQMLANDVIGTSPRLQMLLDDDGLNDAIEEDFQEWAKETNFAETLRLMKISRCQDGEAFAVIGNNPKLSSKVKIKLEPIECDRVHNDTLLEATSFNIIDGIKFDDYNNPEWYSVMKIHPGDYKKLLVPQYIQVPAEYMIHTFMKFRPGLHRGVPELSSALPLFALLRDLDLASITAAQAAANFSAILYTDNPPEGESVDVAPLDAIQLERNMMLTVPAGWKLGQLESKHPSANYSEFVKSILTAISRCVCCTYGSISGDFSGFNYASGRLDNQIYHKSIIVDRNRWETEVLDKLFREWIKEWQLVNNTPIMSRIKHSWFWDGFQHVDPTKEAKAQDTKIANCTTTYSEEYAKAGKDWKTELKQAAKERSFMKNLGLVPDSSQTKSEDDSNE